MPDKGKIATTKSRTEGTKVRSPSAIYSLWAVHKPVKESRSASERNLILRHKTNPAHLIIWAKMISQYIGKRCLSKAEDRYEGTQGLEKLSNYVKISGVSNMCSKSVPSPYHASVGTATPTGVVRPLLPRQTYQDTRSPFIPRQPTRHEVWAVFLINERVEVQLIDRSTF